MADLYIGLMSGTGMDGIDAILVDCSCEPHRILATHDRNILRMSSSSLRRPWHWKACLLQTSRESTGSRSHGICRNRDWQPRSDGRHEPNVPAPCSLHVGEPETIANLTGIDVIADFRRADIEAGVTMESTAAHGLDPDLVEGAAFAWRAKQTRDGKTGISRR